MIVFRQLDDGYADPGSHWHVEYFADPPEHTFPVGTAYLVVLHRDGAKLAQLNFILVADAWRRQGIATKLFRACEERWPHMVTTGPMDEAGAALFHTATSVEPNDEEAVVLPIEEHVDYPHAVEAIIGEHSERRPISFINPDYANHLLTADVIRARDRLTGESAVLLGTRIIERKVADENVPPYNELLIDLDLRSRDLTDMIGVVMTARWECDLEYPDWGEFE